MSDDIEDGHVYQCCGKVGRISRHQSFCPLNAAPTTDLNIRRAEIYAEVSARITIDALPAPRAVSPKEDGSLWLSFDSFEEAQRWTDFFGFDPYVQVYKPDWHPNEIRSMNTSGPSWHGWRVYVTGWSDAEQVTT